MTLEELRARLAALNEERAAIVAAAETRFADPEARKGVEVRGAFVVDDDGNPTGERDKYAGYTDDEIRQLGELDTEEALLTTRIERGEAVEQAAQRGQTARSFADVQFRKDPGDAFDMRRAVENARTNPNELRAQLTTALEESMASDVASEDIMRTIGKVGHARSPQVRAVSAYAIATASDTYRDAFGKYLGNKSDRWTPEERNAVNWADEARAAITINTGLSFPIDIDPTFLHTGTQAVHRWRALATVRTGTENTHKVNLFGSATFAMAADGAEVASDGTPADSSVSIAAQTMQGIMQYTIASGSDLGQLVEEFGPAAADAIGVVESDQFTNGTGSAPEVEGLLDGTTITRVTTGTADTFKEVDLHSVYAALGVRYRRNATWQTSGPGHLDLGLLENTAGFRIDVAPGRDGLPADGMLLRKPWYENSELPGPSAPTVWTTDDVVAIFGDIAQAYRIYDVLGTTVELIPHMFGTTANLPNGTRGLYVRRRLGAGITDAAAARCVKIG